MQFFNIARQCDGQGGIGRNNNSTAAQLRESCGKARRNQETKNRGGAEGIFPPKNNENK